MTIATTCKQSDALAGRENMPYPALTELKRARSSNGVPLLADAPIDALSQ